MHELSAAFLSDLAQRLSRGDQRHVPEPWLALPILAPAPAYSGPEPGWLADALFGPASQIVVGVLVLGPEMAYCELQGQQHAQRLHPQQGGPVRVEYGGVSQQPYVRPRGSRQWQPVSQVRLGAGPTYGVLLRYAWEEARLRQLLQSWYERRVPVQEVYQGQRTFLLNPRMSYDEIQAFKRRYGVSLY